MVVLAGTFLQFSSALTQRQAQAADQKRSFYIAEAGLAESVAGVRVGRTGAVGTNAAPARFGNGLFWVEVTDLGDGQRALKSTGMCGSARTQLDLVVREGGSAVAALGLFSNGALELPSGSLIDAYDSSLPLAEPEEDAGGGLPLEIGGLRIGEIVYFAVESTIDFVEARTLLDDGSVKLYEDIGTPNIARASSNGDVTIHEDLGDVTKVVGDLRPGPSGALTINGAVDIDGSTERLVTGVSLPPVELPAFELGPGYTHSSSSPAVFPAVQEGFEYLIIQSDCQATITGPSTVLLESLIVEPGGELLIDTSGGPVDMFVTEQLDLQEGAYITLTSPDPDPSAFSLQYSGTAEANLLATGEFHGLAFAPSATVNVAQGFEVFGALVGSLLNFTGPATIHFDVALGDAAERGALPSLVSWRILELAGAASPSGNPFTTLGVNKNTLDSPSEAHADQLLSIQYYDRSGTKQAYDGLESAFAWADVSQVLRIDRDGAVVGSVEGLAGIGGIGGGSGLAGLGKLLRVVL